MIQFKKTILFFITITVICCHDGKINGSFENEEIDNDSISLTNGFIDKEYYGIPMLSSHVKNKFFFFSEYKSYPQMYFLKLKSELDIPFRGGYYFLDKTVENIIVNPDGECSIVDSNIQSEFINQFIPFVFSNYNKYDCINNSFNLFKYKNSTEYENKLFDYIKSNPNSYVGLWFLIESFSAKGYKKKYENILPFFSDKIKSEYLFPILQEKINNVEIKLDSKFPSLDFKNSYFNNGKLIFDSKYKYTLIDFWFSRCKPCLELYPELKRLYNEYHDKGFQVVSISVDKTAEIERWKNTIKSHNLEWDQYLDENGILSKENQIISFPTLCLLNEKGILISKNISLEELEGLLRENL